MAGRDPNSYQIQHGPNTHTHPLLLRARTTRRDPSPKYGPRALTPISHSRPKAMTGMPPTRFIIPASSACQLVAHNGQRWEQACPPCSERASSPYAASARSAMHTQRPGVGATREPLACGNTCRTARRLRTAIPRPHLWRVIRYRRRRKICPRGISWLGFACSSGSPRAPQCL